MSASQVDIAARAKSVLEQLDKPASDSKQFEAFNRTLIAIVGLSVSYIVACAIGAPVPEGALGTMLAAITGAGTVGTVSRAWHDRSVRLEAVRTERGPPS